MTLHVFTARIGCRDVDAMDVTRKSGRDGLFLAPSWEILNRAISDRRLVAMTREAAKTGDGFIGLFAEEEENRKRLAEEADAIEAASWARYVPLFVAEMRENYRVNRSQWERLLARPRVVLTCFCSEKDGAPEKCHRTILARDILPKLGAEYGGELKIG